MAVALPYISADYQLSPVAMGVVISAFYASYALTQIPGGLMADKFGVRRVATISLLWWTLFTAITGAVYSLTQMLAARFIFGLGEGVFPACAFKTIAVWFPKKERATANAVMLSFNTLGSALAPLIVVPIISLWGWRTAFYSLLIPGVLMAILFWRFIPDRPSESTRVSSEELDEITEADVSDIQRTEPKVSLIEILKRPNVIKFFVVLFTYDVAYWGYSTWLPTYLVKARGFSLTQMGLTSSLPFLVGVFACIFGGWASDRFFSNNRRLPIVVAQVLSALLLYLTFSARTSTEMVIYLTIAGFTLEFFFSAFWALPMNTTPKELMGVTGGFINMAGQIAAFISPIVIGYLVEAAGGGFSLTFAFLVASLLVSCVIVLTISGKNQLTNHSAIAN